MSTIAENIDTELRRYATLLLDTGFAVYLPKGDRLLTFFLYSREVDGQTLWGTVQSDRPLGGYQHLMLIKPSRENGSVMFVPDAEELTVEAANRVTRPTNWSEVVGTQTNHPPEAWSLESYEQLRA